MGSSVKQSGDGPAPAPSDERRDAAGAGEPDWMASVSAEDRSFVEFLEEHWPRSVGSSLPSGEWSVATDRDHPRSIGRYSIHRELGQGGFASVYLAYDPNASQLVALKVPHAQTTRSVELRRRFEREGRAAAALDHPHINRVYETSNSAAEPYIASHYCAGPTLAAWLKRRLAAVAPRSAARLLAMLAAAVQHAHERGVLHRDLKPSNVLLDPIGAGAESDDAAFEGFIPRLSDFGLAKITQEMVDEPTRDGILLGTPRYMAPEQAVGDFARVTASTDVYALGVMLYELLVGRPPFVGDTELETLRQVRSDEPVSIRRLQPTVPRDLDTIALKCMEKDPARRYASAGELADDLQRFLAGLPVRARPKSIGRRAQSWTRRHPVQAIGLAAAVAIALGVPAGLAWHTVRLERAFQVAEQERVRAQTFEAQARRNEAEAVASAGHVEQLVYASDVRLANRLLKEGDFPAALSLIERHNPAVSKGKERRGFEWQLLDSLRQKARRVWRAHSGDIGLLAFSRAGDVLLTASDSDGLAKTWTASTGKSLAAVPIRKGGDERAAAALSPDGKLVAAVTSHGRVKVWQAATGHIEAELNHTDRVRALAFSPDSAKLLTGGDDTTRIWQVGDWDAPKGELVPTRMAQYSLDGRTLAIVWAPAFTSHISLLDAKSFVEKRAVKSWHPIIDFSMSDDGRLLGVLADGADGTGINLHNLDTGDWFATARWNETRVRGIAFSADGRMLVTGAQDGGLRFWQTAEHLPVGGMRGAGAKISAFAFSLDNRSLATSAGGEFSLWDDSMVRPPVSLAGAAEVGTGVVFNPAENLLAVPGATGDLLLIDPVAGHVVQRLKGHVDIIAEAAFSSDGTLVAAVDRRHLCVWNVSDGKLLWREESIGTRSLAWSPDGQLLATGGNDRLVRLPRLATRQASITSCLI